MPCLAFPYKFEIINAPSGTVIYRFKNFRGVGIRFEPLRQPRAIYKVYVYDDLMSAHDNLPDAFGRLRRFFRRVQKLRMQRYDRDSAEFSVRLTKNYLKRNPNGKLTDMYTAKIENAHAFCWDQETKAIY